ncbi:hypothetical protein Nepgr_033949 [Nepenthes gracilis]|uniref:Uncharacterized protein n=1 Tax=Nepenthes gracilis TaxID=150966 RepID=A0AAD3TLC1_NEPGR|nr:hypothetical protein Nepgr_033949 [Nepenthes gracilis]
MLARNVCLDDWAALSAEPGPGQVSVIFGPVYILSSSPPSLDLVLPLCRCWVLVAALRLADDLAIAFVILGNSVVDPLGHFMNSIDATPVAVGYSQASAFRMPFAGLAGRVAGEVKHRLDVLVSTTAGCEVAFAEVR